VKIPGKAGKKVFTASMEFKSMPQVSVVILAHFAATINGILSKLR